MERGAERFAGMVVVPDSSGGLVRWLVGRAVDPHRTPRFQALSGPKPVLGLGRLGPEPPWAVVAEGLFDWLALTGWGLPAVAALGTQGLERVASALRGCPRVFLAFDNDDAGREATERLLTLLGRRAVAVALPQGVGDVGELAARPHGRDGPLTIDLDSTICETYGLAKEGARHHGYTGKRGYHPLLAVAAGTGDVLMARLREGRANTARGAANFLRETVSRVRYGGASGQLTMRADSGFYTHAVVAVCRRINVRYSITIRQHKSLHNLIEAIPEDAWTPIPYWMDGAADVAETTCTPFQAEADAAPVRLIVRQVKPTPGSQLALFAKYSYHGFITDRDGELLELEADHRRHAEVENAIRDLKYGVGLNHLPSGRFAANGAWLAVQTMAHNLARWTARIGLGERIATTKTLRRRFFSLAGRLTRSARRLTLHLPDRWPWAEKFSRALARLRAIPLPA